MDDEKQNPYLLALGMTALISTVIGLLMLFFPDAVMFGIAFTVIGSATLASGLAVLSRDVVDTRRGGNEEETR